MKSDKLIDAIGMIDPKLLEKSEQSYKKRKWTRISAWTSAVAALLVVAILVGGLVGNPTLPFEDSTTTASNEENNVNPPPSNDPIFDGINPWEPNASPVLQSHTLMSPTYPTMPPYPQKSDENFSQKYDAWFKWKRAQWDTHPEHLFGLEDFFEQTAREFLSKDGDQNRVYSPLNVYMALAMLAETTNGNSRAQILDLLGASSLEYLRAQANTIWYTNYSNDGLTTSLMANSVWLNKNYITDYYNEPLAILRDNYYASSHIGEMGSDEYTQALREWADLQTKGTLRDMLGNMKTEADTLMMLASTVYFEAEWSSKLHEIGVGKFHTPSGIVDCELLYREESKFYYWGEHFSSVSCELKQGNMWFILPDEDVKIEDLFNDKEALSFMTSKSSTKYTDWKNQQFAEVRLTLPKFEISSSLDLANSLQNLGVTDCFDPSKSDFSALTDLPAFVSGIRHSAGVSVDEKGVVASAYTVIDSAGAAPPQGVVDFTLDRPFVFVISNSAGLPLFMGVVNQP